MISPGSTTGFSEFASSLTFSTLDAAQLRHLVQVEVVGDDLPFESAGQFDQLEIDLLHLREVDVGNHHLDTRHLLDLLEDVETAPAAVALERIAGVGDQLQLLQHELRESPACRR